MNQKTKNYSNMRIAILGSGFGLYGYLPALLQITDSKIILPTRYQERLKSRTDVGHFYSNIEWVQDEEELLGNCEAIVIAQAPRQQYSWVKKCLKQKNITHLFLEKPLSFSPKSADELLSDLKSSKKKFRIGYNFRFTDWAKNPDIKNIEWNFCAHHFANNIQTWKREHENGGGALRFYGIHLVALLAEIGYDDAAFSKISPNAETWEVQLIGKNLHPCNIKVATNSDETNFIVSRNSTEITSLLQPFQTEIVNLDPKIDQRVSILKTSLSDLFLNNPTYYDWYETANLLWHNIEKRNQN